MKKCIKKIILSSSLITFSVFPLVLSQNTLVFKNQAKGETALKPSIYENGIPADDTLKKYSVAELQQDIVNHQGILLQTFIYRNRKNIFNDLPTDASGNENLQLDDIINIRYAGSGIIDNFQFMLVYFTLTKWMLPNGQIANYPRTLSLKITHLCQTPTKLLTNSISVGNENYNGKYFRDYDVNTMLRNDDLIKEFIFQTRNQLFNRLPEDFNKNNITIVKKQGIPKNGTITLDFSINKYFNENGDMVNTQGSLTFNNIVISNFKISDLATHFITTGILIPNDHLLHNINPSAITPNSKNESILKQYIVDANIVVNPPPNFKASDIGPIAYTNADDIKGELTIFSISFNRYYDENGDLNNKVIVLNPNYKIGGFKTNASSTQILGPGLNQINLPDLLPQLIYEDIKVKQANANLMKNFILKYMLDTSTKAWFQNDTAPIYDFTISGFDNQKGTITLSEIKLSKYIENGKKFEPLTPKTFPCNNIAISGFLKINDYTKINQPPTGFYDASDIQIDPEVLTPENKNEWTNFQIKITNWIIKHQKQIFTILPSNFDFQKDLVVENLTYNKQANQASFNIKIKNIYLPNYALTNQFTNMGIVLLNNIGFIPNTPLPPSNPEDHIITQNTIQIPSYVWIIIAVCIALIIIAMVIIFILVKRKKENNAFKMLIPNNRNNLIEHNQPVKQPIVQKIYYNKPNVTTTTKTTKILKPQGQNNINNMPNIPIPPKPPYQPNSNPQPNIQRSNMQQPNISNNANIQPNNPNNQFYQPYPSNQNKNKPVMQRPNKINRGF